MYVSNSDNYYEAEYNGARLKILNRYSSLFLIGSGAQGLVIGATDEVTKQKVAIKKLTRPFSKVIHAKRAFRECAIMSLVNHSNVIKLLNTFTPQENLQDFNDIYFVMECMDSDLRQVIRMQLDHERMSFLLYQLLCGIHHLHKSGIFHRDLKPSNIAVNKQCQLKILDFGLSRTSEAETTMLTPYVVTRYYRAPEVVLGISYDAKVDIWSIGCIFAELILGAVLFPGSDHQDQWNKIIEIAGTPSQEFCDQLSPIIKSYVLQLPYCASQPWENIFPNCQFPIFEKAHLTASMAKDLISKMLIIDPANRISINDAIKHPYIACWYNEKEVEGLPPILYDTNVELRDHTVEEWKTLIFDQIKTYERTHDILHHNPINP